MSLVEWAATYGIHYWQILQSSYRKLAWVWFEPMVTEFVWDALTYWAIRPWVRLTLRANFVQLLQGHCLFSATFRFGSLPCTLHLLPPLFLSNFSVENHMSVAEWANICGIHYWQILRKSSTKFSWVGLEPMTTEFRSEALTEWAIKPWVQLTPRANFVQLIQAHRVFSATFHFDCLPSSVPTFILIEFFCRKSYWV